MNFLKTKSMICLFTALFAFTTIDMTVAKSGKYVGAKGEYGRSGANLTQLLAWPGPVVENRPGCYWWWLGSAVDKENLTWNLETMQAAGMGGGTIVPIYGAKGYEDRYIDHLSTAFAEMVSHAAKEAKRLGMWVDMTTGTGWPFGGPMVTEDNCDLSIQLKNGKVIETFSGRKVKRAAPGGGGMAINPYSASAMATYLADFEKRFKCDDQVWPRAMYHDSFEFLGNWSKQFPSEFIKRRGYDLLDHFPALLAGKGDPEMVARIKSDYRETLAELHLEYLEVWVKWSAEKGCITRNQAHGAPANLLDLYGASDIPETETFGASPFDIPGHRREADNVRETFPEPIVSRMASSAAHVMGKPLVASESCTWIRNHFRATLAQAKPEIDQLFLNGINHVFFHGTCYSPKDAPWPGWLFYASFEYNPRNAIWHDAPFFNAYITRCQSILQSGQPDNDVAIYWPIYDVWHDADAKTVQKQFTVHHTEWLIGTTCGDIAEMLGKHGYGYDFFSDKQLLNNKVNNYKVIVVPKTAYMPLRTLEKLLALAKGGHNVIFIDSLPSDIPGFKDIAIGRDRLAQMVVGQQKRVVTQKSLLKRMAASDAICEPLVKKGLQFIRRKHAAGYHYFIANFSAHAVDSWVDLGVPFTSTVILDPMSGATGVAQARNGEAIYLQMLPGESRILRTFDDKKVPSRPLQILSKAGDPHIISGEWHVRFIDGQPVLPATFSTSSLASWTELGDNEAERFAGTARYTIKFELPKQKTDDWKIDLGDVRESARVIINGKSAANLFSIPFSANVGQYLKPGLNVLSIEVTNLSANRIRDLDRRKVDWKVFHDINIVTHNYKKFDASLWPLMPSGLLGPVTLTPMRAR